VPVRDEQDPITALMESVEHDGKPTLAWVVRWSADGREPVQAAWDASEDPWSMVRLLMHTGRDWPLGRYSLVNGRGLGRRAEAAREGSEREYVVLGEEDAPRFLRRNADGAREIRSRIPWAPPLAVVIAPRGNRRARRGG
jgi:hypothetical protein